MQNPNEGTRYILVRVIDGRIEHAEFTHFADDSVYIVAEAFESIIEFAPGACESAWADLKANGFVELSEALVLGLVPAGWEPGGEPAAGACGMS